MNKNIAVGAGAVAIGAALWFFLRPQDASASVAPTDIPTEPPVPTPGAPDRIAIWRAAPADQKEATWSALTPEERATVEAQEIAWTAKLKAEAAAKRARKRRYF